MRCMTPSATIILINTSFKSCVNVKKICQVAPYVHDITRFQSFVTPSALNLDKSWLLHGGLCSKPGFNVTWAEAASCRMDITVNYSIKTISR